MKKTVLVISLLILILCSCQNNDNNLNNQTKGATDYTKQSNESMYYQLDFNDKSELEFAEQGFVDAPESLTLYNDKGNVIWNQSAYSFVNDNTPSPETVNPSLWNYAQISSRYGLYEVQPGVFQVRGYDITNLTLVQGKTGWIIIDPVSSVESAKAAMDLVKKHIEINNISAIVYTSATEYCYGGVKGITSYFNIDESSIPIIAPVGFIESIKKQGFYTGDTLYIKNQDINGSKLEKDEKGNILLNSSVKDLGGTVSFIEPNIIINENLQTQNIDGVDIQFQLQLNSEDVAKMNIYFPSLNLLWLSENISCNLQSDIGVCYNTNIEINFLKDSVHYWGESLNTVIGAHNWPHFGNAQCNSYILNTACTYKYIHDQTINQINKGKTLEEIISSLTLPENLQKCWYIRQYHSTVSENIKAIYQQYMGLYNGNPVYLNPLTKTESAKKFVEYMGDEEKILQSAINDYMQGEYQWVAEITDILINNNPSNEKAKFLCADALEQLGYQQESNLFRNAYLTKANSLRNGTLEENIYNNYDKKYIRDYMTTEDIFNLIGSKLDADKAKNLDLIVEIKLTDTNEEYTITIKNSVLMVYNGSVKNKSATSIKITKDLLFAIIDKEFEKLNSVNITGNENILDTLKDVIT